MRERRVAETLVRAVLAASLLVYAGLALGLGRWWISGLAAPLVAALLWIRHSRARFAAYVLLSVVVLRGLAIGAWSAAAFGVAAILLMQVPPALRLWPRIRRPGPSASTSTSGSSRMGGP